MTTYTPCAGSGQDATSLEHYASQADANGWNRTPAKTYGKCPVCGYTVMQRGYAVRIKVVRHKSQASEAPASPFAADPLNPTDEELAAAIQRGLADGTLVDAADWMAQHAAESGKD